MGAPWKKVVLCLLLSVIAIEAIVVQSKTSEKSHEDVRLAKISNYLGRVKHLMDDRTFLRLTENLNKKTSWNQKGDTSLLQDEHFKENPLGRDMMVREDAPAVLPPLDIDVVEFYFLPEHVLDQNDVSTVESSSYDGTKPLYIVFSDHPAYLLQTMIKLHFADTDKQMILVNWGGIFESFKGPSTESKSFSVNGDDFDINDLMELELFRMPDYRSLVKKVNPAVNEIKTLLQTISDSTQGLAVENVRFVCSGMGCHGAARVGEFYNGTLGSITGVSPAKVRFNKMDITKTLNSDDAEFVAIIHTNGEEYGLEEATGHVDIYLLMDSVCRTAPLPDHYYFCPYVLGLLAFAAFEHEYSADMIRPAAYKCDSKTAFMNGTCSMREALLLGLDMDPTARGLYYHFLNLNPPLATRSTVQSVGSLHPFGDVIRECTNGHSNPSELLTTVHRLTVSTNENNPAIVELFDYSRFLTVHHPEIDRERTIKLMVTPPLIHAIPISEQASDDQKFDLTLRFRNNQLKSGPFELRKLSLEDFTDTNTGGSVNYYSCDVELESWYESAIQLNTTMC